MNNLRRSSLVVCVIMVAVITISGWHQSISGSSVALPFRSDQLTTSIAGATATNLISFQISDVSQVVGSVEIEFCANDPLYEDPCTAPTGLDASGVVLSNQSGNVGFSVSSGSSVNNVILTRTPSIPNTNQNTYQLDNVINPNTDGTYYVRLSIYPTTDASGTDTQTGGIAYAINEAVTVNSVVPPYLNFCAAVAILNYDCSTANSYLIDMGDLSTSSANVASSQFTAATNSRTGYNITVSGTSLTSGNNVIPALASPTASVIGQNSFGINLRANTNPSIGSDPTGPGVVDIEPDYNTPNLYTFINGDTLVTTPTASDNKLFTISYVTNINKSQPSGVYATTLTYICLANF